MILEKDQEVCEDPRGIVVNGDAVRISYQVGIGEGLTKRIGHSLFFLGTFSDFGANVYSRYRHPLLPQGKLPTASVYEV